MGNKNSLDYDSSQLVERTIADMKLSFSKLKKSKFNPKKYNKLKDFENHKIFEKNQSINNLIESISFLLKYLKIKYENDNLFKYIYNQYLFFFQIYQIRYILSEDIRKLNLITLLSPSSNLFINLPHSLFQNELRNILLYLVDLYYEIYNNLFQGNSEEELNEVEFNQFLNTYFVKMNVQFLNNDEKTKKINSIKAKLKENKPLYYYSLYQDLYEVNSKMVEIIYRASTDKVKGNSNICDCLNIISIPAVRNGKLHVNIDFFEDYFSIIRLSSKKYHLIS